LPLRKVDIARSLKDPHQPPISHGVNRYHFKVYALDAEAEAAASLTKDQLLEVMEGHVLDEGELVGTYERQ
jgi:phosphatidylethanolamine-binding protein (PEBP) family uncharacterized protein